MRLTTQVCAALGVLAAWSAAADMVHFVNGDRLTGVLASAEAGMVAIDVPHVGVVVAPERLVAKTVRTSAAVSAPAADGEPAAMPVQRPAENPSPTEPASDSAEDAGAWDVRSDFGLVVATGNTRTQDMDFVVGAERRGKRFDSVIGLSAHRAKARAASNGQLADTKDQFDLDYDLRWKYRETWYAVANFELFRDPIKDIERRITTGLGLGNRFWMSDLGSLDTDVGISQVFEQLHVDGAVDESRRDPALRWSLHFKRWLLAERLELFHSSQLLYIVAADTGSVWDSDTGLRLQLADRWHAGVRLDLQHETRPAASRGRTDLGYALTLGVSL